MDSIYCMINQFRKWLQSPRIWMVFLLFSAFISNSFTGSIRIFCEQYGAGSSIWLFPLALTMNNRRLWVMLLPILLFCDAPFLDEQQPFQIIRTGRIRWAVGQILYILTASGIFFIACFLISFMLVMPYWEFSFEWGKVINTLTQSYVTWDIGMDAMPIEVIHNYTPLAATLLCGGATWIASSFIGLLMFFCNLWFQREAGILFASFFVGFAHFIEGMGISSPAWYQMRYISPVSWMDLSRIGRASASSPSWGYVFAAGTVLLTILSIGILLSVKRKSIEVIKTI